MVLNIFFPFEKPRRYQKDLILDVMQAISEKRNLLVHAPTGLGKTAAVLSPALTFALENNLTVFFLTSRYTQHLIVVETIKAIKRKHKIDLKCVSLASKKELCPQINYDLPINDFYDYCKELKEKNECTFYASTRKKNGNPTIEAKRFLEEIETPLTINELFHKAKEQNLCPYEIALLLAERSNVIVCDYSYILNPFISKTFLAKTKKEIEKAILIFDESHNLPDRARELLSAKITLNQLKKAYKEAVAFDFIEIADKVKEIEKRFIQLVNSIKSKTIMKQYEQLDELNILDDQIEYKINREKLLELLPNSIEEPELMILQFELAGEEIRSVKKRSFLRSVARAISVCLGAEKGFCRFIKIDKNNDNPSINYVCLDPSFITSEPINNAYASILISGTLVPLEMYKDILGIQNAILKEYPSPFPEKNKLTFIVPTATTKFTKRCPEEFCKIAKEITKITDAVKGNCAVFFPSYSILSDVAKFFTLFSQRTVFHEEKGMKKEQRNKIIEQFKTHKEEGAVLFANANGSFSQGIDLPGDFLRCVIVVGLPLKKPDTVTKELIQYYEEKFPTKGIDYAYIIPAITKCMQSAGRCIRTEKDKGVIVFLDKRYISSFYKKCFPTELNFKVSIDPIDEIRSFFGI